MDEDQEDFTPQDDLKKGQYVTILQSNSRRLRLSDQETAVVSYFGSIGIPYKIKAVELPFVILEYKDKQGNPGRLSFDNRIGKLKKIKKSYFDTFYELSQPGQEVIVRNSEGNQSPTG